MTSEKNQRISVDLIFTDPSYTSRDVLLYKDLAIVAFRVLRWTLAIKLSGPFDHFHPKKVSIKWKPLLWFVKGTKTNSLDYMSDLIESKSAEKVAHMNENKVLLKQNT
jgi:hypothetical protein